MPLQCFHQFYWNVSSTVVGPVTGPSKGGYPGWQASIVASGAGALQPWYERLIGWIRDRWALVTLARQIGRFEPERRRILVRTVRALQSDEFAAAQVAVRQTATTLGFTKPEAWIPYSRLLKAQPRRAENVFRHVRACELTRELLESSTSTNPELNLAVELAYCGFAAKGRYFDGRRA